MKRSDTVGMPAAGSPEDVKLLYADVAMGLHAASQPLTVLRAGLCPKNIQVMTRAELLEFAETCAEAVEQTCLLFNLIRELVDTDAMRGGVHPIDLNSVLHEIRESYKPDFEEDGIELRCSCDAPAAAVLGHRFLTLRALTIALHLVRSVSVRGDRVVVRGRDAGSVYEIAVEANNGLRAPNADVSLNLSLMRSVLRRQEATFTYEPDPFYLRLQLKQANTSPRSSIG